MSNYREIAAKVATDFRSYLEDALPRISDAMNRGQASSSFSATLQVAKGKKGQFKATLKPRERVPLEPLEYDMHIDDTGQLALGFVEIEEDEADGGNGLDDEAEAAAPH